MNAEHSFSTDDGDAVVTYSRVPARRQSERAPVRGEPRTGGFADADPHDAVDIPFAASDLRADRRQSVDGLAEDADRTGWLRYGVIGAALAVIAGAGTLVASVGMVTMGPSDTSPGGVISGATVNVPFSDVRQIPLNTDAPTVEARTEIAPPIPRPRPEDVAGRVEPTSDGATVQAASSAQVAPVDDSLLTATTSDGLATPTASVAPAAESGGTDGLITSIEETLARIDANGLPELAPTDAGPAGSPQMPMAAASEPPAVVMTQPIYPPVDPRDTLSDVIPPPYVDGFSSGPVPPEPIPNGPIVSGGYPDVAVPSEPVPQAYPPGPYIYPQSPGVYHTAPGAYPPAVIDDTEARRPGVLRRTFARASLAVGRVLWRN